MKHLLLLLAALAVIAAGDDRIKVDLYSESLWPGCMDVLGNSFNTALQADGFLKMCDLHIWPFGNAREEKTPQGFKFTC